MRRWVRSDKGNILIMMAGAMAVMAGFGILTIDIGRILVTRTQLQNGADAAALAGASLYCEGSPTVEQVRDEARLVGNANQALEANAVNLDILNDDIVIEAVGASGTDHDVTVTTRSDTRQYLLGLFSIFNQSNPNPDDNVAVQTEKGVAAIATARCGGVCGPNCVKPWAPPDRWDDQTGIPGYMGEGNRRTRRPDWRRNDRWDSEFLASRDDRNGNGLYDVGEPYLDDNRNRRYDEEFYHPSLTGYIPDPIAGNYLAPNGDLGLELVLHYANGNTGTVPGQFQSIRLPPINKGTPVPGGDEYRENIENCNQSSIEAGDWLELETGSMVGPTNQGMQRLIAMDPDAQWDSSTESVRGSRFAVSPRIVLIPIYDPRVPVLPGHQGAIQVTKVAAFFMEEMVGSAEVRGRFIKVRAQGSSCAEGQVSFLWNLSLVR